MGEKKRILYILCAYIIVGVTSFLVNILLHNRVSFPLAFIGTIPGIVSLYKIYKNNKGVNFDNKYYAKQIVILLIIILVSVALGPTYTYDQAKQIVISDLEEEGLEFEIKPIGYFSTVVDAEPIPSFFVRRHYFFKVEEEGETYKYFVNPLDGEYFKVQ